MNTIETIWISFCMAIVVLSIKDMVVLCRSYRRFKRLMKDADNAIAAMNKATNQKEIEAHMERFEEIMEHAAEMIKK